MWPRGSQPSCQTFAVLPQSHVWGLTGQGVSGWAVKVARCKCGVRSVKGQSAMGMLCQQSVLGNYLACITCMSIGVLSSQLLACFFVAFSSVDDLLSVQIRRLDFPVSCISWHCNAINYIHSLPLSSAWHNYCSVSLLPCLQQVSVPQRLLPAAVSIDGTFGVQVHLVCKYIHDC